MEFKVTEDKIKEICTKLTTDMKSYIKEKGHEGKGKLSASIEFSFVKEVDKFVIKLSANKYIQYLDGGDFIKEFYKIKKKEIQDMLKDSLNKDIINEIKK